MSDEAKPKITKDMSIMSIIEMNPNAVAVFQKHGLGCIGCMAAHYETVEEGARAHGLNAELLPKNVDNTDMYRMMYATLFGVWLEVAE